MANPTIVLIHGAFGDGSSWRPVFDRLVGDGHTVLAPPNPLRGLRYDASYTASVIDQLDGPVVLVGHSYGGAVITVAGAADNVIGLVYLSGYALEEGESLGQLQGGFPDSELAANLVYTPFPIPGAEDGTDVSVKIEAFPEVFAAGVDPAVSEVLAVAQRPLAALAFSETAPVAAWKTKPAFGIVSAADHTINPDVERFGYKRANFRRVVELDSPHLVMRAHPEEVVQFIVDAIEELA